MQDIVKNINLGFRFIKLFDMGYITVVYFIFAIIIAVFLNKLYGSYNIKKEREKSTFRKCMELVGMIWLNGIIIYLVRNIAPFIPSPFDNIYGFKHTKLKELHSAYVFEFILIYTQATLIKERLMHLYNIVKSDIF